MNPKQKLMLMVASGCTAMAAVLGLLVAVLGGSAGTPGSAQEPWVLGSFQARDQGQRGRISKEFRELYPWRFMTAEQIPLAAEPEPEPEPEPVVLPLQWNFVGVIRQTEKEPRMALVAEDGVIKKYAVGQAFHDGTRVLEVGTQSVRVAVEGEERRLRLYYKNQEEQ